MTDLFPKDPKKIRARIRRYERELRKEYETFGAFDDSYGKRYLLGPLYLLMGNLDGALQSYAWFDKNFPDDVGDPMQYLCWTLALYRANDLDGAKRKLRETMLLNLYLIPHLLGIEQDEIDMWHGTNTAWKEHLDYIPPVIFSLWDDDARQWARETYQSDDMRQVRERYIEIHHQLQTETEYEKRVQLVKEASQLKHGK
jgi:tetratricopeptide (TPR) repeat protein